MNGFNIKPSPYQFIDKILVKHYDNTYFPMMALWIMSVILTQLFLSYYIAEDHLAIIISFLAQANEYNKSKSYVFFKTMYAIIE